MEEAKRLQTTFNEQLAVFRTLQADENTKMRARQQLQQQQSENEMVKQELLLCEDDANVYKLIGPTLIKQDLTEAKSNVQKRIDYISSEIGKLDTQLAANEKAQSSQQNSLLKLQQQLQAVMAAQAKPAA